MAYIGRGTDKISNVEVLDNITFDGSSSYTLQKSSVNFTPSSANTLLLSIDGVVQAGNFTVSGSTIDFGTAVAGTSTCDFVLHYGVGLITAPSDGTVTAAKLADSSVSLAKLTATGTKDATTFLRGDNSFAEVVSGLTVADQWRLTADFTSSGTTLSSNLERVDTSGQGTIGTAMSVSSGTFTFPQTGIYNITFQAEVDMNADCRWFIVYIESTRNNGSSWTEIAEGAAFLQQTSSNYTPAQVSTDSLFDCADTSNHKVRFKIAAVDASLNFKGSSVDNETHMTFIRLGDT